MNELNLKEGEVVKPMLGFEQRYLVTNYGRVFSVNGRYNGIKEISPSLGKINNKHHYYVFHLRDKKNGIKHKVKRTHQLVAENFLVKPETESKLCVNHKDGDKLNNKHTNLEWVTYLENSKHAIRSGLFNTKGEKHAFCKITENDVRLIREYHSKGYTHEHIAKILEYKIGRRHITDIINKKCWGWLV